MIAVAVVRHGQLPAGADEAVAEAGGRALLAGEGCVEAASALTGIAHQVTVVETSTVGAAALAGALAVLLADEPHVVLPASADGRDLAPRLAAELGRPLLAGAVEVRPDAVVLVRNGGRELHHVEPGPRFVATLVPGVRGVVAHGDAMLHVTSAAVTIPHAHDVTVVATLPPDPATVDLGEAPRIVAAGAGLDGAERLAQLARIGERLGASVGATRVVTDRGWAPHSRQIGTTGVVVDPELYLAFGISGAVQHTAGLGNPEHVVTVNTDPHCPMMQRSDLAVVADANATLDALEALLTGTGAER